MTIAGRDCFGLRPRNDRKKHFVIQSNTMFNSPQRKFSKLYDKYIEKIYRFVFIKVGSQEITEDLCSEVFVRTWNAYRNGQKIENPQAFLYKTARNLVVDYYRKKGRAKVISADIYPEINDPKVDLEKDAVLKSDFDMARKALANLKPKYQEVIIWRYIDEFSVREIAEILNKPKGAVRVTLHRALKTLRNELS